LAAVTAAIKSLGVATEELFARSGCVEMVSIVNSSVMRAAMSAYRHFMNEPLLVESL
jgi:hypothetical protein